jgi:hypothetical protein
LSQYDYQTFQNRHNKAKVHTKPLNEYQGNAFLGIDAGSTTTKMALIGENEEVLYSFYEKNKGNPIETVREGLNSLYEVLPNHVHISRSVVTGYGEKLIQAAYLPNLAEEKLQKLFKRTGLAGAAAYRGKIGIPRVLNMFENYPFWHQFFTELGFEVVLSDPSNKELFEKGIETIPSESVCYPAKLAHGHVLNLVEKGIHWVFYPSVVFEKNENNTLQNHFNCPVVTSYPEVIRVNMARVLEEKQVDFLNPFISLDAPGALLNALSACFADIPKQELKSAIKRANQEESLYIRWLRNRGEEVINQLIRENKKGIVITGHPYHIDPAINHGLGLPFH